MAPVAPAPVPPHLSAAHGPTGGYCLSKPFFSLLLSSLTDRGGAEEARFSGFAAPALPDTYRPMGGRQVREPEPPEPCQRGPKHPPTGGAMARPTWAVDPPLVLKKILGLVHFPHPTQNISSSTYHIKSFDACMEH
jgi:hypothetical protein